DQVADLAISLRHPRYPSRSDGSRPSGRQMDKRRVADIAMRPASHHAQIGDASAVADQMDPLVPDLNPTIVHRIHMDLDHGMENLARRQTRQFAVDDPYQRQD